MSVRAPVGPVNFATEECCIGRGLAAIRSRSGVDRDFLFYFLQYKEAEICGSEGAVFASISKNEIARISIAYPPLLEQQRIVGILDEAFEGIATARANAERNLQRARELFDSRLDAAVSQHDDSWTEKPLREFARAVSTGPFGSLLHKSDYVSDGVPLVNPINIVGNTIVPDTSKLISPKTAEGLQAYVLREADIVIGRRGEIGRCAVVGPEQAGWMCGTGCFFIRPLEGVNSRFLAHLIRSSSYRDELERASTGATMKNLSNQALGDLPVAIPRLSEQDAIVGSLESMQEETDRLESLYRRKLAALDELKQSLLHQAFTGAL